LVLVALDHFLCKSLQSRALVIGNQHLHAVCVCGRWVRSVQRNKV
jgi:hypothetical protein